MSGTLQGEGGWVFVSHSHRDLDKVREIRNELERLGHNPLLFFLKCLEDDDAQLPQLIEKEIEARTWFILCDSTNAQASKWVQKEFELVKAMSDKKFEIIDLDKETKTELPKVTRLSKRATVFLSYVRSDSGVAGRIREVLRKHDFRIWFDSEALSPGIDWVPEIENAIQEVSQRGFVLVLLSPAAIESPWIRQEIDYAVRRTRESGRVNIISVIVRHFDWHAIPAELRNLQFFNLTVEPFQDRMEELVHILKTTDVE
ncbi:MAG: toll/interleukin-1 receptor domain-containing protein [Limisphaerales bacterium]